MADTKHKIAEIEDIDAATEEQLAGLGVKTTEDLLTRGATPSGRKELARSLERQESEILRWVNHADLMRVKGIGMQFADLLEEAGVDTIPELARRNAANLHAALAELNEQEGHAGRSPTEDEVAQWVEQAKGLERAIEYRDGPTEPGAEEPGAEDAPTPEEPVADEPAPAQALAAVAEPTDVPPPAAGEPAPEAPKPVAKPKAAKPRVKKAVAKDRAKPKPARVKPAERKAIVRLPKPERDRGQRKERRGVVVSSAMDKTIVVRVDTVKPHPKYKKVVRHSARFHAHDEGNVAAVGDLVRIVETRPLSALKRWRLAEVVQAAR